MSEIFELSLAAISWEPQIRGALAVLIGFVVLCGSVYLLLATNSGARTGLLIAIAGLFGWMSIMGIIWWVYGIGWAGESPSWEPLEIDFGGGDTAVTEVVAEDPDFDTWEPIPPSDPEYGELEAAASEALTAGNPPAFESPAGYLINDVYETGGKDERDGDGVVDRVTHRIETTLQLTHPTHYAAVVVQRVRDTEAPEPGEAPPTAEVDPAAPEVALVLQRDLGNLRLTPAVFTFFSMVVFGITANALHRRDKLEAENRARAESVEV